MEQASIKVEHERSEAAAWDDGCLTDSIRNEFLVPRLARLFEKERPSIILDIGTGTGYIPRKVDEQIDYQPKWTLVDVNGERLRIARRRKTPGMRIRTLQGRFAELELKDGSFDAVLLTFTILEAEDSQTMLTTAVEVLADNGLLIIAMPDVWRDVLAAKGDAPNLPHRLLGETVALPKIDKFTGHPYPFYAMRTESLISTVLNHFCILEGLERGGPHGEIYLLIFRKRGRHSSELTRV